MADATDPKQLRDDFERLSEADQRVEMLRAMCAVCSEAMARSGSPLDVGLLTDLAMETDLGSEVCSALADAATDRADADDAWVDSMESHWEDHDREDHERGVPR